MSGESGERRDWRFYINDMIEFAEKVLSYTSGVDRATFTANTLTYDATLRNLELIGEAATHVPDEVREEHPDIPWRAIIGARNRLAHGYLAMNDDLIWSMIQDGIPDLLSALRRLSDEVNKT